MKEIEKEIQWQIISVDRADGNQARSQWDLQKKSAIRVQGVTITDANAGWSSLSTYTIMSDLASDNQKHSWDLKAPNHQTRAGPQFKNV